jgi:hypothetical protein
MGVATGEATGCEKAAQTTWVRMESYLHHATCQPKIAQGYERKFRLKGRNG